MKNRRTPTIGGEDGEEVISPVPNSSSQNDSTLQYQQPLDSSEDLSAPQYSILEAENPLLSEDPLDLDKPNTTNVRLIARIKKAASKTVAFDKKPLARQTSEALLTPKR